MYNIYKIINPANKIYVGKTKKSLNIRLSQHKYESDKRLNNKLSKSIKKYGIENHQIILIESVKDLRTANIKESYYIQKFNTINNGLNTYIGLNVEFNINELKDFYHY